MAVFKIDSFLRTIFFLLLLCGSSVSFGTNRVEYRVSRVHGLLVYAQSLMGRPHLPVVYAELWKKSRFHKTETQDAVSDLQKLTPLLHSQINFEGTSGFRSRDLIQFIVIQSIFSQTLEDLGQRTLGLLPMNEHRRFFSALKTLEPSYEDLVWKKGRWELLAHQKQLETFSAQVNLDELFVKTKKFYNAHWPKDLPFTIGLYAVPFVQDGKNPTNSSSLGSVEEHGVLTGGGKEDPAGSFGVIFHELCHSLFDARSEDVAKSTETFFSENPSPYRWQAKAWANEALATALGNGWVFETLAKKSDEKSWYADPVVDGYAHQIFPLTKEYVTNGKSMDRAYVNKMISLFAAKFPDSILTYENLFNGLGIIHSKNVLSTTEVMNMFFSKFFVSSLNTSSPILDPQSAETLKNANTAVIILSPEEIFSLTNLADSSPLLKKNLPMVLTMKSRGYFSASGEDGKAVVVILAKTKDDLSIALDHLKQAHRIDPKQPLHTY